ncbi:hypothetical protein C2G38_1910086, partial [Gigaspora rosea]
FTLRAHVLSLSGDLLALAKVMYTTGHNSYKACRFCSIQGIYCQRNRHEYYPLKPPTGMSGRRYDPKDLPLRTHENYVRDAIAIEHINGKLYKDGAQKRGLNGRSILFELNSIEFPISFPVDIMHVLFENVAPAMLRHWSSTFFKDSQISNADYILSNSDWTKIVKIMESNRKNMPLNFGRPLIDIQRHSAAFKAEDWLNWVVLYLLPLLQDYLPERYLNGWTKFVYMTKLCLKKSISIEELAEISNLFREFVTHYEK